MIHHNAFERNSTETVTIRMKSIGEVQKIKIVSDNSGPAPGWFLSYVDVNHDGVHRHFNVNGWIEKPNLTRIVHAG